MDLHTTPAVAESPTQQVMGGNQTPIVEDCEGSPSHVNPTPTHNKEIPVRKSNSRLLSRSRSTGVSHGDHNPIPHYYSHTTPPKHPRPPSHTGTHHSPSAKPRLLKQTTPSQMKRNSGDKSTIDLMVTSARMVIIEKNTVHNIFA